MAPGPGAERIEQGLADAVAARVGPHADQLDAQATHVTAELAFEHAGQDGAGQALLIDGRKLRVQRGFAPRRGQAPLDIGAARAALDRGVDGDHGGQIGGG